MTGKSPIDEYFDDLWETCDFPRPRQPSETMKAVRLRAAKDDHPAADCNSEETATNNGHVDQLDPRHYRYVTNEIRKIRSERASDRNIEWTLGRPETPPDKRKTPTTPVKMQSVRNTSPSEYAVSLPTEPPINVQSRSDFPELK